MLLLVFVVCWLRNAFTTMLSSFNMFLWVCIVSIHVAVYTVYNNYICYVCLWPMGQFFFIGYILLNSSSDAQFEYFGPLYRILDKQYPLQWISQVQNRPCQSKRRTSFKCSCSQPVQGGIIGHNMCFVRNKSQMSSFFVFSSRWKDFALFDDKPEANKPF